MSQVIYFLVNVLDVLIVTFLFYRLYILLRGTRAALMLNGFLVIILASFLAELLGLGTFSWIMAHLQTVWVIAFIILFQHEIRAGLAQLGRNRLVGRILKVDHDIAYVSEIVRAAEGLARSGLGGLIVLERETGLRNYAENGVSIDAELTADLIETIFTPPSPLHDGAVIVRGNRVVAARVLLPLSTDSSLSRVHGTRHRAAIGISEESDALVVVVSEETRSISLCVGGTLDRGLEAATLRKELIRHLSVEQERKAEEE